ncbi:uncharacterized protein LOC122195949 [Lactuca sativa]|uniref:uncharacterized protein LOC122195949 n=1 Tax=Lactuca sativa TaxID=4236 RepID=UPI001C68C097|nr:uncharacterized protein LOC122195949 [Lactuca sativa]
MSPYLQPIESVNTKYTLYRTPSHFDHKRTQEIVHHHHQIIHHFPQHRLLLPEKKAKSGFRNWHGYSRHIFLSCDCSETVGGLPGLLLSTGISWNWLRLVYR